MFLEFLPLLLLICESCVGVVHFFLVFGSKCVYVVFGCFDVLCKCEGLFLYLGEFLGKGVNFVGNGSCAGLVLGRVVGIEMTGRGLVWL